MTTSASWKAAVSTRSSTSRRITPTSWLAWRTRLFERPGLATGIFLIGYALARGAVELVREPDPLLADLPLLTMGQLLSLPMLIAGLLLVVYARRARPEADA